MATSLIITLCRLDLLTEIPLSGHSGRLQLKLSLAYFRAMPLGVMVDSSCELNIRIMNTLHYK